jgi:CRP-like cAMP-binding protein
VKVFKAGSRGRHHVLYLARAGDVLGLESLLTGDRHTATAEVLEPGTVCQIERAELSRLIDDRPELLREIARTMARQLEACGTERTGLASAPVRERLALTLVSLGAKFGDPQGESVRIGVDLSREELAEIVGASTETVIRQLSEFRDKGILTTDGRSIVLQDTDRLARIARLPAAEL